MRAPPSKDSLSHLASWLQLQLQLSSFFSSSLPKLRLPKTPDPFSSSTATPISTNSLWDTNLTATTASSPLMSSPSLPPYSSVESPKQRPNKKMTKAKAKKKGVVEQGVAVVESSDPYLDFRTGLDAPDDNGDGDLRVGRPPR